MKHVYFKICAISLALILTVALASSLRAQDTLRIKTGNIENICLVYPLTTINWLQTYSGIEPSINGLVVSGNTGTFTSLPVKVPLERAEPFISFSCILNMENAAVNWGTLSVRSTIDGTHYTDWQTLTFESNTDTAYFGELISLDKRTQWVEYKVDITNTTSEFNIKKIKLSFINPGKTETKTLLKLKKKMVNANEIAGVSKPTVVSRTDWGCGHGQVAPLWSPNYSVVTHLVIHHTAGSNDVPQDYPATVRSIWSYHTFSTGQGWGDIGYNYLIDPDGNLYEGRAGGNNAIGAHCSFNSGTMGVSVLGTYINVLPSKEALDELTNLLAWKCIDSHIDPLDTVFHASSGKDIPTICGHRDVKETECPGLTFYNQIEPIRKDVNTLLTNIKSSISTSENSKTVLPLGETINVEVVTSLPYFSYSCDASWVTLNRNANTITAQVAANNTTKARKAIITISGEGSYSQQVVLSQAVISTSIFNNENKTLSCYPNPFDETLTISTSTIKDKNILVEVKNMLGQTVYQSVHENKLNGILDINLSNLISGSYLISIKSNSTVYSGLKVMKK